MRIASVGRWLCLGMVAVGLSGCTHESQVSITSNKLNAYNANIKRLLVITDLGAALKFKAAGSDQETVFENSFTKSLGQCGIVVQFRRHDPLALGNEAQDAIRAFQPDTVMALQWKSAHTYYGVPEQVSLKGSILDMRTKRPVWKADISFAPAANAGTTFAATTINNLKASAIIGQACAAPAVPKV